MNSYRKRAFQTEAGQGIMEYILVLLLTVTLVIGLSRGVAKPMVDHLRTKIFDLVGCMLRVGELPHIAIDICGGDEALNLDFEGAAASASTGGGGSGGDGNSSSDDTDGSGDEEDTDAGRDGDSTANVRDSASNGSLDGGGRGGAGTNGRRGTDGFTFDDDSGDTKINIDAEEGGANSSFESKVPTEDGGSVIVTKIRRKSEQIGGGFTLISEEEAKDNEIRNTATPTTVVKSENSEETFRKVSSFSVENDRTNVGRDITDNEGVEFSFMKFIKWGLIIAIIVIFLLFSFTQLNSIRKGWTE